MTEENARRELGARLRAERVARRRGIIPASSGKVGNSR
jgi:hypothetical protein